MNIEVFFQIGMIVILPLLFFLVRSKKKITHWLLVAYIGLLLLAVVATFFIKTEAPKVSNGKMTDLYGLVSSGELLSKGSDFLLEENSYVVEGDTLQISSVNPSNTNANIYVERKAEDNNQVEVYHYGNIIIAGIDVSEERELPVIRMEKEKLLIVYGKDQELNASVVMNEFTINQFTGESKMDSDFQTDGPIIYIRIPHSLEVKGDSTIDFIFTDELE